MHIPEGSTGPVTLNAPATIGNFGPGFDVTSLALHGLGDTLTLAKAEEDSLQVQGPGAQGIPTAWKENIAGVTLDLLRRAHGVDTGVSVTLHKPRAAGSGLGSSASSAAGAALAFHGLFPELELTPEALVRAAGQAEGGASSPHYDDVAAVVLGGLAIVRKREQGFKLSRVPPPRGLHLALAVPEVSLPTVAMRELLPAQVPLQDAVFNLGNTAALVDAFHREDVATVGACLEDRLATPARKTKLPFFDQARKAGRQAGAAGVALAGSGPTMVGVCASARVAQAVAEAMQQAITEHGVEADALTARPEHEVPYDAVTVR